MLGEVFGHVQGAQLVLVETETAEAFSAAVPSEAVVFEVDIDSGEVTSEYSTNSG